MKKLFFILLIFCSVGVFSQATYEYRINIHTGMWDMVRQDITDLSAIMDSISVHRDSLDNYSADLLSLFDSISVHRDSLNNYSTDLINLFDSISVHRDSLDNYSTDLINLLDSISIHRTAIDLNTTHRSSDGSDHSFINQDVTTTGSPTFDDVIVDNLSADSIHADTAVVNYLTVVHAPENTSPDTAATFDGDTVTKTVIVDIESGSYEKLTTDTVLFTTWSNGTATNDLITVSLADDATYDLVDARSGWGFVQLGDNISNAYFTFTSAGAVTLVTNLECTTTQGTNDKLNIYDAGTNVRLENTWAATSQVTINITYNL